MSELRPDRRILRASDADRERAVDFLRRHAAEGRLDVEELSDRVGKALCSKTLGELDDLTYDLPAESALLPAVPPPRPAQRANGIATGLVISRIALIYLLLFSGLSIGHHALRFVVILMLLFVALSWRAARRAGRRAGRATRRGYGDNRPFGPWV